MRGATANRGYFEYDLCDFNPRAPCGARRAWSTPSRTISHFNPRAPCGARRDSTSDFRRSLINFNPRAPCGARPADIVARCGLVVFQPTRPLRGATRFQEQSNRREEFQPTRPLRGATWRSEEKAAVFVISTHAPLAGRDLLPTTLAPSSSYFNPRAPCGARLRRIDLCFDVVIFQPTRPLRGATVVQR